ncbi:MAG TPA: DnaA N-terminal domain-containing protein [Nitrolancea sp.]|nr:DnaA N-terminal domain-containing protein [Nitrolancea sp.]
MPEEVPIGSGADNDEAAGRSGEDARRRGWFWHWNSVITQYAPLIGLKGVGLLNSYTVWTDRREESPHRGYAFPSQQSEADFYGEDRAELITINKILVALDLIEIRKEMVPRVDERGRRWRVPHNLYRVKDHRDGFDLTVADVLRVAELANRDRAVYRYVRRIFSPRLSPIDADNVWHRILPVVRQSEDWQQAAAQAAKEDARASARTKAGHASRSRSGSKEEPVTRAHSDHAEATDEASPIAEILDDHRTTVGRSNNDPNPDVAPSNNGLAIAVAPGNDGLGVDVASGNEGLSPEEETFDGRCNEGDRNIVDESNTTYYQNTITTTTTTGSPHRKSSDSGSPDGGRTTFGSAGPVLDAAASVLSCFTAANGREASPLERELLAELETEFDAAARRAGAAAADWVVAAIREAVNSGSRFVAPKRIREILARWAAEPGDHLRPGSTSAPAPVASLDLAPDVPLPHGFGSRRTWEFTLRLLSQALDNTELERLFGGSAIASYQSGTVTVAVSSQEIARRLTTQYVDLITRKLSDAMRRPVQVRFIAPSSGSEDGESVVVAPQAALDRSPELEPTRNGPVPLPRFTLPGGLTNLQVWAAVQDELARRLTPANYETWVRPSMLLAQDADGSIVVGAPNALAGRRLARFLPEIELALRGILEQPVRARIVVSSEWQHLPATGNSSPRPPTEETR